MPNAHRLSYGDDPTARVVTRISGGISDCEFGGKTPCKMRGHPEILVP